MTTRKQIQNQFQQLLDLHPRKAADMKEYLNPNLSTEVKEKYSIPNVYDLTERPGGLFPKHQYDVYIFDSEKTMKISGKSKSDSYYTSDYIVLGFTSEDEIATYFLYNNVYETTRLTDYVNANILHKYSKTITNYYNTLNRKRELEFAFGTEGLIWKQFIQNELKKNYFHELNHFIEKEYQTKTIFPKKEDIYRGFVLCPFEKTKVIILGQDPYHNFDQAHGLAFSVKKGNKIPPSLRNIYKELHNDLGVDIPQHGDLTKWAEQGVLLLNTILTVEAHMPMSHAKKGWEIFTDTVIKELNKDDNPKVFVLWGNNARKKSVLITNPMHLIIESSHPSPLSARHSFFNSKMFSKINNFLYNRIGKTIDFSIE